MNRIPLLRLLPAIAGLAMVVSCGRPSAPAGPVTPPVDPFVERQIPPALAPDVAKVVAANNQFALDVYGAVRGASGNLFLSPYSISSAFAMVYAGARGTTAREIGDVFHFDAEQDSLHPAFGALRRSLDRGVNLGGYEIHVANRLWGQSGEPFRPAFLDVTRTEYGAEMEIVDFRSDPEAIRTQINAWVLGQTAGRIEDLFPPASISTDTRLVLANAIYFKGKWQFPFDAAGTRERDFILSPGARVRVPAMQMTATVPFFAGSGVSVLALPYGGRDLEMIIVLPESADGLSAMESRLTAETLAGWTGALVEADVAITLPRFGFTSSFNLGEVLRRMGMPTAFTDQADFTGIREAGRLSISDAFHKAFVLVNEEGTEAAGATGVVIGPTSAPLAAQFIADHPFLFLIRDRVTGSILFLGRVTDPRS